MAADLHSLVAGILQSMTHAELSEAPQRIAGLVVQTGRPLKAAAYRGGARNFTQEDLARLALKFVRHGGGIALDEAAHEVLEASDPPLTRITRRDIARLFGNNLPK